MPDCIQGVQIIFGGSDIEMAVDLRGIAGQHFAAEPFRHLFHLFANTAYFACTFARMKDVHTWIRYWKYRLEYLSRIPEAAPSESQPRHDVRLVIAGLTGAVCGMVRFFIHGTRRGLPSAVIDQYTHTQESLR